MMVAKAFKAPSTTVLNCSLLASLLSLLRTGSNVWSARFCMLVQICAQVMGMLSNLALVSSATEKRAFLTTSAVTWPSWAYCLMEPSAMPMYCSMALAMPGAFSRMEFSSSPLRAPAAIAWVSWSMAAACPWADAPPMVNWRLTCSIKAMSSSLELKAAPAFAPMLAIADAVPR